MARRIIGSVLCLIGLAVLAGLGLAIYRRDTGDLLVGLGIPGALLLSLLGLSLAVIGGAMVLGSRDRE